MSDMEKIRENGTNLDVVGSDDIDIGFDPVKEASDKVVNGSEADQEGLDDSCWKWPGPVCKTERQWKEVTNKI